MLYRLLRNNIESGPFSKEEIVKQGLLPSDQIKPDGESHWRAANSFDEFKEITTHFQKPKFKITANKEVIEIKETPAEKTSGNSTEKNALNSPFKRVPSAIPRKRDEKPSVREATSSQMHSVAQPAVKSIESAPRLEKKERKLQPTKKETKASESVFKKEVTIPIFILAMIGLLAWFGYKKLTTPANTAKPVYALQDSSAENITKKDSTIAASTATPKNTVTKVAPVKDSSKSSVAADSLNKKTDSTNKNAIAVITSTQKQDTVAKLKETVPNKEETFSKKIITQNNIHEKEAKQPIKTTAKKADNKSKSINDYISLSLNKTPDKEIRNIKIRVKNISQQALNIAVIDVKYLDAQGNTITGETLQATNINAGKTVTVKVPNNKNAVNISYKVSLISGDSLYLMAH